MFSLHTCYVMVLVDKRLLLPTPLLFPTPRISSFLFPFFSLSFLLLSLLFGEQSAPADDTTGSHYGHTMTRFFFLVVVFSSVILLSQGRNGSDSRAVRVYSPWAVLVRTEHSLRLRRRLMVQFLEHANKKSFYLCTASQYPPTLVIPQVTNGSCRTTLPLLLLFKTSAIIKHSASSNTIRFLDLTRLFSLRPTRTRPNYLMSLRSRLICSSHRCWTFNGLCVCVCASLVKKTEDFGNNQNKTLETELIFVSTFVQMKAKVLIINNKKIDQCKPENTFRASRLLLLSLSSVHYYVSFLFCVFKSILCTIRVGSHANFESTRRWKSSHFSPIILPHFLFE